MEELHQGKEKLLHENERLRKRISELESENASLKATTADPDDKWSILGESEQTYKTIFENTGAATCIVDKDGTIVLANSRFASYTGKPQEEIENRLKWMEFVHEEDLAEMMKQHQLRRTHPEKARKEYEFRFLHPTYGIKNGYIHIDIIPGTDKSVASIIDITDLKKAEEKFTAYITNSPTAVYVTNARGDYTYVNPAATELQGFSKEEFLGMNVIDGVHEDNKEQDLKTLNDVLQGKLVRQEISLATRSGRKVYAVLSAVKLTEDQYIGYCTDVTDRRKAEEDLKVAKERAEESDRLKSAFLANMSHEIRTPMNGILGFLELLREPDITLDEKEEYISIIHRSGQRLLNTINDIIELSRIESGQMQSELSKVNLDEELDYHYLFFSQQAGEKGLKIRLNKAACNEISWIETHKSILDTAITNLMKNAIKFTKSGSIELGCELQDTMLLVYVKDTGMGIPADKKAIIFDRFVQGDQSDARMHEGSGLGLPIVKASLELVGGRIWVDSTPGMGSTFYFTLPYIPAIHEKEKDEEVPEVATPLKKAQKKIPRDARILVAEDDPVAYDYLAVVLKAQGLQVLHARTGQETIDLVKYHPDIGLVLMDWKMPVMDGLEATRQIRKFNRDIPIVVQTAQAMAGDEDIALEAGCNAYLTKPIRQKVLLDTLARYLSHE